MKKTQNIDYLKQEKEQLEKHTHNKENLWIQYFHSILQSIIASIIFSLILLFFS